MRLSVIISTYNSPEWLEKVLWGYMVQTLQDFELLVGDDGSGPETAVVIREMQKRSSFPIRHIWHKDLAFRKCEILNKAVMAATTDYLVFSDGDCIPRADFLMKHYERRRQNCFLSGGCVRLPLKLSHEIDSCHVFSQEAFRKHWLKGKFMKLPFFKGLKLTRSALIGELMNSITPTRATWNGGNSSVWKEDVIAVNGFDQRMGYGGEDREFGERLLNKGLRGIQVRYSAACIHLDHGRAYRNDETMRRNMEIRQSTRKSGNFWTEFGIVRREDIMV
jgi:glycosyltransferase involved in cell wall biosynthesis